MEAKHTKALLTLLFAGVLMGAVDLALIGPALPAIQDEFGMDERQLSLLFNAYVLFQLLGTPLLAKCSDRFGPRLIYIVSIGLFAAGSLVLVAASQPLGLYAGRAIQGFGAGGIFPVASAVIAMQLPDRERGPALGILGMVFGLAFLLGPVLGGILLRFSWQWLFLINLPIAAVLVAGAIKLLPTEGKAKPAPFDVAGAMALTVGLTALVFAVNNVDSNALIESLFSWNVGGPLCVLLITLPVFWRVERDAADPVVDLSFFRSRQIMIAVSVSCGVGALQAGGVFAPALLVSATGMTEANASWLLLPGVLVSTLASPVAGRLVNSIGARMVVLTSTLLLVASSAIYGLADIGIVSFLLASSLSGLGMAGLLGAPLRFIVLRESRPGEHASGQSLLSVASSVGRLVGAATVGSIATSVGGGTPGYQSAFVAMTLLAAALFLFAWPLQRQGAKRPQEAAATSAASA